MIIRELHHIQRRAGYLPRAELAALAARLGAPLSRIQEVASFFPHFKLTPPAPVEVHVCRDMSCALRGSCGLHAELQRRAAGLVGQPIDVKLISCLGRCDRAPAVAVSMHGEHSSTRYYLTRTADEIWNAAESGLLGKPPPGDSDMAHVPAQFRDWTIDVDHGKPAYRAVRQFVERAARHAESALARDEDHPRHAVIRLLEESGLLGMGGAGGRAYKKWQDVMEACGNRKYVICNADESEPGTFKDREILLRMPHLIVEGMVLAGLVVGAESGYVYIRHEYEEAIESVREGIADAVAAGICGGNLLGSGHNFELEVFVSPGGYICGEQSALVQVLEDKRSEPRNRPPELQTNGLHDQPTLVNNVETLAWVPAIVLAEPARRFADAGRPGFRGRRLFSISGDVARPGVYEVANGTTLRELVYDLAGGMREGAALKAVALSGPSGGFTPARVPVKSLGESYRQGRVAEEAIEFDLLDFELDIETSRKARLMLGAGIVVYGTSADLVEQARVCQEFYHRESCGKCVPCRLGSRKLFEYAEQLERGEWPADGAASRSGLLRELAGAMGQASICGLGKVAPNPLATLLKHFPAECEERLQRTG